MKNKYMQTTVGTFLALLMLFGFTQIFVSGQESETSDLQEKQAERSRDSLVGAWRTAVTRLNCQTGEPLAPASRGLFTFNEGGTLSEYNAGPGSTPAMRSPGHGVWEQNDNRGNYSFVFVINRYDASGVFIGIQKITATLALSSDFRSVDGIFNTIARVEIFDANDNLIGTGCATGVGTRIK